MTTGTASTAYSKPAAQETWTMSVGQDPSVSEASVPHAIALGNAVTTDWVGAAPGPYFPLGTRGRGGDRHGQQVLAFVQGLSWRRMITR